MSKSFSINLHTGKFLDFQVYWYITERYSQLAFSEYCVFEFNNKLLIPKPIKAMKIRDSLKEIYKLILEKYTFTWVTWFEKYFYWRKFTTFTTFIILKLLCLQLNFETKKLNIEFISITVVITFFYSFLMCLNRDTNPFWSLSWRKFFKRGTKG